MSLQQLFQQGGTVLLTLIPLGICSVLVIAVVLERLWAFARIGGIPQELFRRVEGLLATNQWPEALRLLDDSPSPYARIAKASVLRKSDSFQEISDILTLACDAEVSAASRPLPVLGTIGNIAPFIGLFGTVIGIMRAFHEIARQRSTGAEVVSAGIAEALIATAAGLGIGIIAVVANNWFNAWVERYRLDLERFATEWAYRLHHLQSEAQQETTVLEPQP